MSSPGNEHREPTSMFTHVCAQKLVIFSFYSSSARESACGNASICTFFFALNSFYLSSAQQSPCENAQVCVFYFVLCHLCLLSTQKSACGNAYVSCFLLCPILLLLIKRPAVRLCKYLCLFFVGRPLLLALPYSRVRWCKCWYLYSES